MQFLRSFHAAAAVATAWYRSAYLWRWHTQEAAMPATHSLHLTVLPDLLSLEQATSTHTPVWLPFFLSLLCIGVLTTYQFQQMARPTGHLILVDADRAGRAVLHCV